MFESDGPRHFLKEGKESDARRDADFLSVGIRTIRIPNDNISLISCVDASIEYTPQTIKKRRIVKGAKSSKAFSEDVEKIYAAYPTRCKTSNRLTHKCSRDKVRITSLLKEGFDADDIVSSIQAYISECVVSGLYMCNFEKFLTYYLQGYLCTDE